MSSYRKTIEEGTFQHRFYEALGFPPIPDEGGVPLVIRITLDDMELMDGFYMSLPSDVGSLSIGDVVRNCVLCEREADRISVRQRLAADPNPDLIDIHDALLYLYKQDAAGGIRIGYHINNGGSDIQPTDPVSRHQKHYIANGVSYNLLDLVLEVQDTLNPFCGLTDEQKNAMLEDFRRIFVLYAMDRCRMQDAGCWIQDADLGGEDHLSNILDYLSSDDAGLIYNEGGYFITPKGYDLLNSIISEAEFYIDNYDIFGDVYVKGHEEIKFDKGCGDDLIIPVFIREEIDPYRAIFMAALYLGNLDYLISDPGLLFSEEPFKDLFGLIALSPTVEDVGANLLDRVISEGKLRVEEQRLSEARSQHIEKIHRRMRYSH